MMGGSFGELARQLHDALPIGRQHAVACSSHHCGLEESRANKTACEGLLVGLGSPSTSGCVAARGEKLERGSFSDAETLFVLHAAWC